MIVRHETEPKKQFDSADALVAELKTIDYDGGTDLGYEDPTSLSLLLYLCLSLYLSVLF